MHFPHARWLILLLILAGARLAAADAAPTVIFIARHGEKASPSGDVPLSEAGRARAEALAALLDRAGVSAIYSSELTFARETAVPLATRRGLQPVVIPVKEREQLAAAVENLAPGTVTLVINHNSNIPALLEKLTGVKVPALEGHHQLFVVTRSPGGPGKLVELRYGAPE